MIKKIFFFYRENIAFLKSNLILINPKFLDIGQSVIQLSFFLVRNQIIIDNKLYTFI